MKKLFAAIAVLMLAMLAACGTQETAPPAGEPAPVAEEPTAAPEAAAAPAEAAPEETKPSVFKSLKDVISASAAMKCTWTDAKGNSGEMKVKGKQYRMDARGEGGIAHIVSDGAYMYLWSDGQQEGVKIALDEVEQLQGQYGGQASPTPDMEAEMDYSCSPTIVSASDFTPPSGIQFTDMGEMMAKALQGMGQQ
jgi:hypothetical protein